jgi:NCS1 family nucleobase:cation symporter-1
MSVSYKDHPDLLPIPNDKRTTTGWQYVLMILSMAITTSIFFLGWISEILGLNLLQTVVAAFIGNTVVAIVMYLNGYVGVKYGIPFPVQLRPSFGYRGSLLPLLVRAIVSIFWYGVDGYIAAWAMTEMILVLLGKPPEWITANGLFYAPYTFIFYLLLVWIFGYYRITGIKYFDTVAGPLLLIFFGWFTFYMTGIPNMPGKMPTWTGGGVSWASNEFFLAVAIQTAWWGTIALNVSDICRWNKSTSSLISGHVLGLIFPQVVGTALGFIATTLAGGNYSPIDIIAKYSPSAAIAFFGLIFAFMATASTNLTGDVPAATNAIIRITRLGWVKSLTIATILAWLLIGPYSMVNWKQSLDVANYLTNFNWYYSMWLGPIAGVMVVDFWLVRKKEYILDELYNIGPQGKYWYSGGINWIGVGSFLAGIIGEYLISGARGTIQFYYGIPVPGEELAWYYGFFISLFLYWLLALAFKEYALPEKYSKKQ